MSMPNNVQSFFKDVQITPSGQVWVSFNALDSLEFPLTVDRWLKCPEVVDIILLDMPADQKQQILRLRKLPLDLATSYILSNYSGNTNQAVSELAADVLSYLLSVGFAMLGTRLEGKQKNTSDGEFNDVSGVFNSVKGTKAAYIVDKTSEGEQPKDIFDKFFGN